MTNYPNVCKENSFLAELTGENYAGAKPTLSGMLTTVAIWYERSKQRSNLHNLDDHMLSDIGISREEMAAEAAKPFWKA